MIDVNITGRRVKSVYEVPVDLGEYSVSLKWDTGAKYTVISIGALRKDLTPDNLVKFKAYCEEHHKRKEQFISATGDIFWGYKVTAINAVVDKTEFDEFSYYLVIENKRDIALLGFDFIDNCERCADANSDIVVRAFNDEKYLGEESGMDSSELISFIDSLMGNVP